MSTYAATTARLNVLSLHWGFSIGGVSKYAAIIDEVSKHAPIDMQTVCIVCPDWRCDRATLARLSAKEILIKSRFDVSWIRRVAREIDQIKPDLIMTHGFNGHFVVMATGSLRRHPTNLICSYHGAYHPPTRGRKIFETPFNLITEHFIRHPALAVVSVSEYSKKYLVRKGVDPDKITVIHNGIDSAVIPSKKVRPGLRREWGVEDDEALLGVASRLDPIKGISYLVTAFGQLVRRIDRLKLVIVGTGPFEDTLKRYVKEMALSARVVFTGFRSDVADCLSAFDVFVLPSLAENHSITLLEAMRAKKAIIATDVGGNTESVRHEREALVVRCADVEALGEAIERLLSDASLRARIARAAYERFHQKFTTEQMVQQTAEWILRCATLVPTKG